MKKFLAIALVMILALSLLAACTGGSNSNTPNIVNAANEAWVGSIAYVFLANGTYKSYTLDGESNGDGTYKIEGTSLKIDSTAYPFTLDANNLKLTISGTDYSYTRTPNFLSGSDTPSTDEVYTIPKDKRNALSWDTSEKQAVIAEIPEELFKAIGKLTYCQIQSSGALEGYKYTLNIRTSNANGEADLDKLLNYYRSIGGAVENSSKGYGYDVKFDYAESVEVNSPGSYIQVLFSVVKK